MYNTNEEPTEQEAEALYFASTGTITPAELRQQYGLLSPQEMLLKLAEFKNFNAARDLFLEAQESNPTDTQSWLMQEFQNLNMLNYPLDRYIALCFLYKLIEEQIAQTC